MTAVPFVEGMDATDLVDLGDVFGRWVVTVPQMDEWRRRLREWENRYPDWEASGVDWSARGPWFIPPSCGALPIPERRSAV